MSIEQNKQVAAQFFALFSANDIAGALSIMADDATWRIPGKPTAFASAGVHSKEQIARIFHRMVGQMKNGMQMTAKSAIGEGDSVALEVESYGELKNGRVYNNEYHILMKLRDGRICEVREYLDTQHAFATWFQA